MLLELFRTHKRWLMFIATVLVVPSFVVTGIYSYNRMISDDGAIATVDGDPVLPSKFDEAKRKQLESLRQALGDQFRANMLDNQQAKHLLLKKVLSDVSLMNDAVKENVIISDETVIQMIKTFPAFQENGQFSRKKYENYLRSIGQSDEYFVYVIRNDITRQLVSGGVAKTSITPTAVVNFVNNALTEKRTAKFYSIPAKDFMKEVKVTDEEVKSYWEKNQKAFELPDEIDVDYVVLTPDLFKGATPSQEEIETFYKQNPNRFRENEKRRASHILINLDQGDEAAKKQAEEILKQVQANAGEFSELAKKFSKDPGSAKNGGDLGYFEHGQMVEEFDKAVFGGKKGDIVGLVKTQFGYHIIQINDIKDAFIKPLKDVREEIVSLYEEQQSQKKFAEEAENFTNIAYEQSDSLDPLVEKYGIKVHHVKNVLAQGPMEPEEKQYLNGNVMEALFSEECLKEKRNTQASEVSQNTLVVARVVNYRPAHVQTLDSTKDQIKLMLEEVKALEKASKKGESVLADLKSKKLDTQLFGNEETMSRSMPGGRSYDVLGAVLRVPANELPAFVGVADHDRYTIAYVTKSELEPLDNVKTEGMRSELTKILGRADEAVYLDALRRKHKATITNKDYLPEASAAKDAK